MAKIVTQETFDGVVRENIDEFEMSPEEAIQDAVQQFEAQGVDLSNIVRDLSLHSNDGETSGQHPIVIAIESLATALEISDVESIPNLCDKIRNECDVDLAHRCLGGSNGAYKTLFEAWDFAKSDVKSLKSCLLALCSLCNGQPDLLENVGKNKVLSLLRSDSTDPDLTLLCVRFVRYTCLKHEENRQNYVSDDVIQILSEVLSQNKTNKDILKEVCGAFRVLTLDDDLRVPFGKAHEHAKMIVTEAGALGKIMDICQNYIEETSVLGELFSTLGRLAVRNEFCQQIMDLGGLQLMLQTLEKNMDHQGITRQVLAVLKPIAGNDDVKVAIVTHRGVELILTAMSKYAKHSGICESGCAALTTVVLRNPAHCKRVMEAGGADILIKVLQLHQENSSIQKQACMAIRNLVGRTPEYRPVFLELGAEVLIQQTYSKHKDCHDEAKAALRDLGCKVELRELWKGEGREISH